MSAEEIFFDDDIPQVLVGQEAPDFTAQAVIANGSIREFNLKRDTKGKIALLIFYPLDFTFVCPSELIAFDKQIKEFEKRNVKIIAISVDSQFSHQAYRMLPKKEGGIGPIGIEMVSDLDKSISRRYGVLFNNSVAFRANFLIDQNGKVRHQLVNDLPLGRDVDEALRIIDALIFHQEHGDVCPANWKQGKKGMKATAQGVKEYLSTNEESDN